MTQEILDKLEVTQNEISRVSEKLQKQDKDVAQEWKIIEYKFGQIYKKAKKEMK